jgi:hypothetical protein
MFELFELSRCPQLPQTERGSRRGHDKVLPNLPIFARIALTPDSSPPLSSDGSVFNELLRFQL